MQRRPDGTTERWSYRDLWDRSVAVAQSLIACGLGQGRAGRRPHDQPGRVLARPCSAARWPAASRCRSARSPLRTNWTISSPNRPARCSCWSGTYSRRDFAQILRDLEPAIGTASPGGPASHRFPFLRRVAMVDSDIPMGAIEGWRSFLARGAKVPPEQVAARAAAVMPSDPGALFFSSGSTNKPKGILSAHRGVADPAVAHAATAGAGRRRPHLDGQRIFLVRQFCHGDRWNAFGRRHAGAPADVSTGSSA